MQLSGETLGALTDEVIRIWVERHGHGPESGKSYEGDNLVFTVLRGGMTPEERTLVEHGREEVVRQTRSVFESVLFDDYVELVERVTRRPLLDYHSQILFRADLTIEIFVLGE